MKYAANRNFAAQADIDDPLRQYRDSFFLPQAKNGLDCIYLCGNSLGLQPRSAASQVRQELDDWARLGVEGHFQARRPWLSYHRHAKRGLATLTGAKQNEVVAMNSLTVNLHLLMTTFYRPRKGRSRILIEAGAFPSDRFAVESQIRLHGFDPKTDLVEWSPRDGESELRVEDFQTILNQHGDEIALILLPGVQYLSGQLLDMPTICDIAADAGCVVGLDLAHAIGNVPLRLHDWQTDFAVWCSYKYLNSGPGAIAGAFVHQKHHGGSGQKQFLGWWSHDEQTRMKMSATFSAEQGADLWQLSCPSVLSFAPLIASLKLFDTAGMDAIRQKSLQLTGYLDFLLQQGFAGRVDTITPAAARGAQISITIIDQDVAAKSVFQGLLEQNVIVDWREPDVIRVAPAPLYNSFEDVFEFTQRLEKALTGPAC